MPCRGSIENLSPHRRALVLTLVTFLFLTSIFVIVFATLPDGVWASYKSRPCENYCENSHQCDHELEDRPVIQQPINTWTNLAYLLVGLWPLMNRLDVGTVMFFVANSYVCIGSFVFHASLTLFWMTMDVAGMFVVLTTLVGHGIHVTTGLTWWILALPVVAVGIVVPLKRAEMYAAGFGSTRWFTAAIICILILDVILLVARGRRIFRDWDQTRTRPGKVLEMIRVALVAAVPGILFPLARFIRSKDVNKEWCNPDSMLQGHGAWHILTAVAILFIWSFFDHNRLAVLMAPPSSDSIADNQDDERVEKEGLEAETELDLKTIEEPPLSASTGARKRCLTPVPHPQEPEHI